MTPCPLSAETMGAWLDGELDASAALDVSRHLHDYPACAEAMAELAAQRDRVRGEASRYASPPHLRQAIRGAIRQAAGTGPARRRNGRPRWPWAWINLGLAGAATAAFALTLVLYLGQPSAETRLDQDIAASHFRSLAGQLTAQLPGQLMGQRLTDVLSSDQHTVKPWFAGKLDFSPPVYDLAAQGFPLLGGRLDYVGGRPVAALAYGHGKHFLNLYLWPQRGSDTAPTRALQQGYRLVSWTRASMRYVAISDMNQTELDAFARQLDAQAAHDQRAP